VNFFFFESIKDFIRKQVESTRCAQPLQRKDTQAGHYKKQPRGKLKGDKENNIGSKNKNQQQHQVQTTAVQIRVRPLRTDFLFLEWLAIKFSTEKRL
jgi:hypothetical protein